MVDRPRDTGVRLSLRSDESAALLYYAFYLGFSRIAEKLVAPTSDKKKANKNKGLSDEMLNIAVIVFIVRGVLSDLSAILGSP
jgi:hypothetical protein